MGNPNANLITQLFEEVGRVHELGLEVTDPIEGAHWLGYESALLHVISHLSGLEPKLSQSDVNEAFSRLDKSEKS